MESFFCSCNFHCFVDGNKRLAITLTALFLLKIDKKRSSSQRDVSSIFL
ncbi:TPA: Fic family protein [Enterococcus faecalis]